MPLQIAILEDNEDRQRAMRDCLEDRFPQYGIRFFATVPEMLWFLQRHIEELLVIGLDHDLELIPTSDNQLLDPGTGRDMADYLASISPVCPVVIHSTNAVAAEGMTQVLEDAGWQVSRVVPFDDLQWISAIWFRMVRDAIVATAIPAAENVTGLER